MKLRLNIKSNDLAKTKANMRMASMGGINDGAEWVLGEAGKIVPHDEGILEGSGHVTDDPSTIQSAVNYDTPYARKLHENPRYNFQGKGQGKWLENTMKRTSEISKVISSGIKKRM